MELHEKLSVLHMCEQSDQDEHFRKMTSVTQMKYWSGCPTKEIISGVLHLKPIQLA
jgi:hypothetical protein